ncbi:MAG TPA: serpin family protein [Steroidobacteraceae bacterium]|nr:serpin family protein [Steroidobacteraceae bacterium]
MASPGAWIREDIEHEITSADTLLRSLPADCRADDPNEFALALYGRLRTDAGNHVSSPLSIGLVLVASYAGAKGTTAEGIRTALQLPAAAEAPESCTTIAGLATAFGHQVTLASALWHSTHASLLPGFSERLQELGTDVSSIDFRDAGGAVAAIDAWIRQRTGGLIPKLLGSAPFSPLTRLVFATAVHFTGRWSLAFDAEDTREQPFFTGRGREVRARLMQQRTAGGYLEAGDHESLTLRYQGGDLAMMILLPRDAEALEALESRLSAQFVREHLRARFTTVDVVLPRLKIRWGTRDLKNALVELGMQQAFGADADFSGINGLAPPHPEALHIEKVLHQACVEVNEEGTEASAATVMDHVTLGIPSEATRIPVFRADRPFLFLLCALRTGTILFMGRMVDPTAE